MTCPDCGGMTVATPDGTHLNPQPGRLGRHLKDGTILTPNDIRNPSVRGYYPHHCPPAPPTKQSTQDSLF